MNRLIVKIIAVTLILLLVGMGYFISINLTIPDHADLVNNTFQEIPETPNAVSSLTIQEDKWVEPWPMIKDIKTSWHKVLETISNHGGIIVHQKEYNYIHAVFISDLMGFRDDVEWLFDHHNLIHYKSASRVGYSDMGVNRQRYELLLNDFKND